MRPEDRRFAARRSALVTGRADTVGGVLDQRLRPHTDSLLNPVATGLGRVTGPNPVTALVGLSGLGAGFLAADGRFVMALAVFAANRVLDGLDGAIARNTGRAGDRGGLLDLLADMLGYAAIPIGLAVFRNDGAVWLAAAVVLASYYLNIAALLFTSALAERRGFGRRTTGEMTTLAMPTALIEGTETIVAYVLFLAFPGAALWLFWAMAALVGVTIIQRVQLAA